MKVLVVGGNRFLGWQLGWRLLAAGHGVTLFNRGRLPDPFGTRVERIVGDRTTGDFPRALASRRFDAVVDLAVFQGPDAAGAVEVLSGRVGHYVMISTGQVYLVRQGCPRPAQETDYDGPLLPEPDAAHSDHAEWAYGMGKRAAEDVLAAAWARAQFPSTRLRIPMVHGERDYHRRLESYLWRLLDGGGLIVPDGGGHRVRHVYGMDVVRAVHGLLARSDTFGQAYNLCQDETPTLDEWLRALARVAGAPARLVPVPSSRLLSAGLDPKAVSPLSARWMSFLDPSRARALLAFRAEPLEPMLDKIVTSFYAHTPTEPPPSYASRAAERALIAEVAAAG